jgi:Reverse transcriptase (RNA-dependent DNA polymerase)
MGLIDCGTFRIEVIPDEERRNKNIVASKFVYALKHENGEVAYKARFCLGGHRDLMKNLMAHTASTLRQRSVRLLLALAAIFGLEVWSTDVAQAYLQSAVPLQRDIVCKTDALELGPNEILKLVLPLYGLSESGDYWGATCVEHHLTDLQFNQSKLDFSLFWRKIGRNLCMSGTYVDDLLRAATPEVRKELQKATERRFDCKESKELPTTFCGLDLTRTPSGFATSICDYILRLQLLDRGP